MAKFIHADGGKSVLKQKRIMRVKSLLSKLFISIQFVMICYLVLKANNLV